MESTRQAKISRLLQKELSEIFRQQTAKTHGTLVSVSIVRVSPDLSVAKAYRFFHRKNRRSCLKAYAKAPRQSVMNSRSVSASSCENVRNFRSILTILWIISTTSTNF